MQQLPLRDVLSDTVAGMNEVTIIAMITLGSYQALGNIKRVYSSDPADIPAKVGSVNGLSAKHAGASSMVARCA